MRQILVALWKTAFVSLAVAAVLAYSAFPHRVAVHGLARLEFREPVPPQALELVELTADFTKASEVFEVASVEILHGGAVYFETDMDAAALWIDGQVTEIEKGAFDLSGVRWGKYVAQRDGFVGLYSVMGEELLPPIYLSIEYIDDTLIAMGEQSYHIFSGGVRVSSIAVGSVGSVRLLDSNLICIDDGFAQTISLDYFFVEGYNVFDVYDGGYIIASTDKGETLFGYADENGVFIKPYIAGFAFAFFDGIALAYRFLGGMFFLDKLGNEYSAAAVQGMTIMGNHSGGYICFNDGKNILFFNPTNGDIIYTGFRALQFNQLVNGLVAALGDNGYWLARLDGTAVSGEYQGFWVLDGYFIAETLDGGYELLDSYGNVVAAADYMQYSNGLLVARVGNLAQIFERV